MAFDVTNAPTMNADSILWELAPVADMGYMMSEAQVGVLPGGSAWKVFVANGYHSPSGKAALLVKGTEALSAAFHVVSAGMIGVAL